MIYSKGATLSLGPRKMIEALLHCPAPKECLIRLWVQQLQAMVIFLITNLKLTFNYFEKKRKIKMLQQDSFLSLFRRP